MLDKNNCRSKTAAVVFHWGFGAKNIGSADGIKSFSKITTYDMI